MIATTMALHLIKLCVGCDSIKDLRAWIREKLQEKKRRKLPLEHWHTTRMVPKRAVELIDGGSLYWVIRGQISCRQRFLDVRPFRDGDGVGRCRLVLEPKLLILDEPTEGIQPNIVHEIGDIILKLNRDIGVTVLIVEQKLPFARRIASQFRILEKGRCVAGGPIEQLTDDVVGLHLSV